MIESLKSFIEKNKLFKKTDKLILAISGGVDSMVMLDLLAKLEYSIVVCHVNHELRTKESDDDEAFVKLCANERKLDFYLQKIGIQLKSISSGNLQDKARALRYAFFNKILNKTKADYILTAHHQDDQIETVLHNLFRGTGIQGLSGIEVKRGNLVRPLLAFSKQEILAYAKANNIAYKEDTSNRESKYARNKIRNKILPILSELFTDVDTRILKTIENVTDSSELLDYLVSKLKQDYLTLNDGHIEISKELLSLDKAPSILYHILKPYGFNRTQSDIILENQDKTGKKIISSEWRMTVEREFLKLTNIKERNANKNHYLIPGETIQLSDTCRIRSCVKQKDITDQDEYDACLDMSNLEQLLLLRKWEPGDSFKPLGLAGKTQNISKALRNYKVDHSEKENALVLISGTDIVWLIPHRISEDYRMTSETKEVLCLSYEND